ncbi:MAG: hypothetical protein L0H84_16470 [Pseudonocardia sp.]|nr:hypothetical protein [Pseudonocardia sp.]
MNSPRRPELSAGEQHLLQRVQILRSELLVAAQPLQGNMILVLFEVLRGLRAEALHVRSRRAARQVDLDPSPSSPSKSV